jgi:hypothetical protein
LVCRRSGEAAILVWTYDGTSLIGVASRADGDSAALHQWWLDSARTLTGL